MTFDATMPGTSADAWNSTIAEAPTFDLDGFTELFVVAAHPDDETLGTGGLIARFADAGLPVRVVVVTDGGASHPDSRTHSGRELARRRAGESRDALTVLAPTAQLELLGFADGQARENASSIAEALTTEIARLPETALIAAPWHGDRHRDHRVVAEIVAELAAGRAFVEYPIWMWHWATPSHEAMPHLATIPIDRNRKSAAIARHVSQVEPMSDDVGDEAMLRQDFLEHFDRDVEVLIPGSSSMSADYFEGLYARRADPWRLATRWYEERKRSITMASLPERRFGRALEVGSSIGMLTELLRDRCDRLVTMDISAAAVAATRERVGDSVTVLQADVTDGLPAGPFDLVVLSEMGYYLSARALEKLIANVRLSLSENGTVVVCHWRHPVDEYLQTGDAVHAAVASRLGLAALVNHRERDFLLDVYSAEDRSVAEREGLL